MMKNLELSDPNSCLNKAHEHEDLFVLLGRDKATPATIRFWVQERIRLGLNTPGDTQTVEALNCAAAIQTQKAVA